MKTIGVRELSPVDFKPYGAYADMLHPRGPVFTHGAEGYYRDMEVMTLGPSNAPAFSINYTVERDKIIEFVEYHTATGEGILPLDGDILIYVAPATGKDARPLDQLEVYRVPKGTLVVLNPGVWHGTPFTYKCRTANVVIVLPERAYANDCDTIFLEESQKIRIEP